MKAVLLSNKKGIIKHALIDDEDFDLISKHSWHLLFNRKEHYARAKIKGKRVFMHSFLIGNRAGMVIDHCDGDGLNNRRSNLRHCSLAQNAMNRKKITNCSSLYKGVCLVKSKKRHPWYASIVVDRKQKHLGVFKTEAEAAHAYNMAAAFHFGDFAKVNQIREVQGIFIASAATRGSKK